MLAVSKLRMKCCLFTGPQTLEVVKEAIEELRSQGCVGVEHDAVHRRPVI